MLTQPISKRRKPVSTIFETLSIREGVHTRKLDQSQTPDVLRSTIEASPPSVFRACGRQLFSVQEASREALLAVCDVFHASFKITQVPPHLLEDKAKRVEAFNRLNGKVPRETLAPRAGERFCEIVQR